MSTHVYSQSIQKGNGTIRVNEHCEKVKTISETGECNQEIGVLGEISRSGSWGYTSNPMKSG